jgi:hypothetical protein
MVYAFCVRLILTVITFLGHVTFFRDSNTGVIVDTGKSGELSLEVWLGEQRGSWPILLGLRGVIGGCSYSFILSIHGALGRGYLNLLQSSRKLVANVNQSLLLLLGELSELVLDGEEFRGEVLDDLVQCLDGKVFCSK